MSFPRQVLPNRVYLVTRRCTQRRFLLRPDDDTNNAFLYCLAYAARRSDIEVVAFIANTNHYHAIVVDTKGLIPRFLEDFHKLLAKHQNALHGRRENMWSTEQTSLVELQGADDVLAKTVYTLGNPVKDHLVERVAEWPGSSSLTATLTGAPMTAARPRRFFRRQGKMPETIELRCVRPALLAGVSAADYKATLESGLQQVQRDAALERRTMNRRVLGRDAILALDPEARPSSEEPRRTLSPRIAARDPRARVEAIQHTKHFRADYFVARNVWLTGATALFPAGTWWLRKFAAVPCVATVAPD